MTSFDTNILLYAFSRASPFHSPARRFLEELTPRDNVGVSELVLAEFYTLLMNPSVLEQPLSADAAVAVVQTYRRHPRWMLLGFGSDSRALHEELWSLASRAGSGRGRIYDARLALSLRQQGVTKFATANVKDFASLGFVHVWNPVGPADTESGALDLIHQGVH